MGMFDEAEFYIDEADKILYPTMIFRYVDGEYLPALDRFDRILQQKCRDSRGDIYWMNVEVYADTTS